MPNLCNSHDCDVICRFSDNGGSFSDIAGLLNYCKFSGLIESNCVLYYLTNCREYIPPSSSSQQYSSTSSECPSGNNDFNFENVMRGFSDYNEVFYTIFACFILVKLLNLIK